MTNIIEFTDKDKERQKITDAILDNIAGQIQILENQKQEIQKQREYIESVIRLKKFKIVSSHE